MFRRKGTHMKTTGKVVAWICIFSTLLMGCYFPVAIDPNGKEKEDLSGTKIKYLVTKDGRRYDFDEPPKIYEGLGIIIGQVQTIDTVKVSMPEPGAEKITMVESDNLLSLTTKSGKEYKFDKPPTIVNGMIYVKGHRSDTVSIPLANVVEVHGSQYDSEATTVLVVFAAIAVTLGAAAIITYETMGPIGFNSH